MYHFKSRSVLSHAYVAHAVCSIELASLNDIAFRGQDYHGIESRRAIGKRNRSIGLQVSCSMHQREFRNLVFVTCDKVAPRILQSSKHQK